MGHTRPVQLERLPGLGHSDPQIHPLDEGCLAPVEQLLRTSSCIQLHPLPTPWPRAPLTTLAGSPVLGGTFIQSLLLPVMVFISFAVTARTCADATLERPAAQYLSTVGWAQRGCELEAPLLTLPASQKPLRTGLETERLLRRASPPCVRGMPPTAPPLPSFQGRLTPGSPG